MLWRLRRLSSRARDVGCYGIVVRGRVVVSLGPYVVGHPGDERSVGEP